MSNQIIFEEERNRKDKIELIMQYIETNKIPSGRNSLRFCDIASHRTDSRLNVGVWIQIQLQKNDLQLLKDCSEYQERYPNAFSKMELKIKRRHQYPINEERLRIVMQYLEYNQIKDIDLNLRFCDLDPTFGDDKKIKTWFQNTIASNWMKDAIEPFKSTYPQAYQILKQRILNLEASKQIIKLTEEEKLISFLRYINTHPLPNYQSKITFKEMDSTTNDNNNVDSWLRREISTNTDPFLELCQKYKEEYPNAVQKVEQRVELLMRKRQQHPNYNLSFEEKVPILMAYLEQNEIPTHPNPLRFCDLDPQVTDESKVGTWINRILSKNLTLFLDLILEYQNTYPVAYQKLSKKMNESRVSLRQERLLLIEELKRIRTLALIEELRVQNSLKKKKKKSTK